MLCQLLILSELQQRQNPLSLTPAGKLSFTSMPHLWYTFFISAWPTSTLLGSVFPVLLSMRLPVLHSLSRVAIARKD